MPLPPATPWLSPPLEAYSDLTWQPPTGQVAAMNLEAGLADPDIWSLEPDELELVATADDPLGLLVAAAAGRAAVAEADASAGPATTGAETETEADNWAGTAAGEGSAPGLDELLDEPVTDDARWAELDAEGDTAAASGSPTGVIAAATVAGTVNPPRNQGLLRSNLIVASGTAVSRLTGFVRTFLIIYLLFKGLGDAFINANNTPNMIYELILGGILTASLVPLFSDDLERGDGQEATSAIISVALVALLGVTVIGLIGGPLLILLFSTGSAAARRQDYIDVGIPLALLFAPQIFFYGLMAVWSAVLNARRRFLAAAWAPVLNNLIAIATLVYAGTLLEDRLNAGPGTAAARKHPGLSLQAALDNRSILWILGIGTTLGIAVMALSLYPALRRSGFRLKFKLRLHHPAVQRAIRLSAWTLGYVIANQIAVVVIQILARPSSGDASNYQVSYQWFQLPHALLAVSIMVTFEPLLGRADSRGDLKEFNDQLLLGFRLIGLLIIPAAAGYVALPQGLDAIRFSPSDGSALGIALSLTGIIAAFALGLPGFSTYLFALRGFYAKKNTKIPFFINCAENAINIALAIVFVRWWGVIGLALAFAAAYSISAVVAVVVLNRHSPGFDTKGLVQTWAKLLIAAAIMGGFVYGLVAMLAPTSQAMLIPTVAAGILVGIVTYFASIYALQVPGISELMTRLPGLRRFA
jgi:putative peptidoglycan lipid II flippase